MLDLLIESLQHQETYPFFSRKIEVIQTHISIVVLLDDFVYKLHKPVKTPFLDFSTLDLRKVDCEREITLNRRLAPDVYIGVVPLSKTGDKFRFEVNKEVVEWAVKMHRLPDNATLLSRLERGELSREAIRSLASKIAKFHKQAESSEAMSKYGHARGVIGNALDNFDESNRFIEKTISQRNWLTLRELTRAFGNILYNQIESRAKSGIIRDTHGDLRLDHIYWFPNAPEPNDWAIIDCIEFNEKYRYADPLADIAFVLMDLAFRGYRELANVFKEAYLEETCEHDCEKLLQFYTAYRSAVRAKVESIQSEDENVPTSQRQKIANTAKAHWIFALSELSEPHRKPCLLLIGGLPGTGKSTLAKELATSCNFQVIRTDVVRKQLFNNISKDRLYSSEATKNTYSECCRQAENAIFSGDRVIIDANFPTDSSASAFFDLSAKYAIPCWYLECQTSEAVAKERISSRTLDASDADETTYDQLAKNRDSFELRRGSNRISIDTTGSRKESLKQAMEFLSRIKLITLDHEFSSQDKGNSNA